MTYPTHCQACGAPIIWLIAEPTGKNPNPKPNPINAQADLLGNILLLENGRYRILTKDELEGARQKGWLLCTSHFATCPNAQQFRRK